MNGGTKMNFAGAMLLVSILLFFLGFMILCECPLWFAFAALFAGLAMPRGSRAVRSCAILVCAAAVTMTIVQTIHLRRDLASRQIRRSAARDTATNTSSKLKP
jgi:hypothetical protein